MSGSQHKKQEKARRKAEREKARLEERRRNVMTGIIVGVVVLVGALLIVLSVNSGDDEISQEDTDALLSELNASVSEAAAAGSEVEATPSEMIPDDTDVEPGVPVDSGLEPRVDDRPVACDAVEPANVADIRPQFPGGPGRALEDGVDYAAVVQTSCGQITFDLLEDDAPATVNSWVFLAQQGFFDGLEIFRNATSIGALQTGGGDQTNTWSIGYSLPDELGLAQANGYPVGAVAMANSGPNSGGSQFFFVYTDAFNAAFQGAETFAVFGQVIEGLDVLERIGAIESDGETPLQRIYMDSVEIVEQ